jgi:L-lactate dehydrogenase (cytochrome)
MTSPWITVDDVRAAARRRLPTMIFDFVDGAAGDEVTLRRNRSAFDDIRLAPRVLVDVSRPSLGVTVLGQDVDLPVLLSPTGMPALVHPDAELAAARAAARRGTLMTVGTTASCSLAQVREVTTAPLMFQLYAWRDRDLTAQLIERAREARCVALMVTVDTPVAGNRERDLRNGMRVPPKLSRRTAWDLARHPGWALRFRRGPGITLGNLAALDAAPRSDALGVAGWFQHLFNPAQTWADIEWIRTRWAGPLVVKGVQSAVDAARARDAGATAVVVSNHGGRQLDGVAASVESLPLVAAALAGDPVEVWIDGGIRRGIDVARCLALGASAVLIGRPWLYGLAAGGEEGVGAVLDIIRDELYTTLQLLGCPDASMLDDTFVDSRGR